MKGFFYLEVWKIDSVFLYQVYLLNYQNCVYIGMYLRGSCMAVKRLNMILNSRRESFSKTVMFLRAFKKLPQNVQQKVERCS